MSLDFIKNPKIVLIITLIVVIPFITFNLAHTLTSKQEVLSENASLNPSPSLAKTINNLLPSQSPQPSSSQTPQPKKPSYSIAIIGDSMVDTMGENLQYLQEALFARYPQTNFKLYNYGIGGQNVEKGLERFKQSFSYQTRSFPPLPQLSPDIIIVASFAYNPFDPHNRDKHWLTLTSLINEAKNTQADVYVLAEIAPLKNGFGVGPQGANWPENLAHLQAVHIVEQLENAVALASTQNIPLINAFKKSQIDGQFGQRIYVSGNDGIHPSEEGHLLMAGLIASTIKLK